MPPASKIYCRRVALIENQVWMGGELEGMSPKDIEFSWDKFRDNIASKSCRPHW